jgi:NitT/TauT family transport system permease protein
MSVTTSTCDDVSFEIPSYAHAGAGLPVTRSKEARVSRLRIMEQFLAIAPPLVLGLILLISWYIGTTRGLISSLILPVPADFFASLANGFTSGVLLSSALVTIQESLLGFLLALVVALPLGYGLARSRLLASSLQPYLAAGQAIPAIITASLLIYWLGAGLLPVTIVCMLVVFFPMVITTVLGMSSIDSEVLEAARLDGAARWSLLLSIEFPLALPAILAGVRTGLTLSITGAVVGEFVVGGEQGLGSLVQVAREQFNTPLVFATLFILGLLAALYYSITWLLVKLAKATY